LKDLYTISESRLDSKKIYSRLVLEWDLVKRNMSLMDLQDTLLTESDIEEVLQVLATPSLNIHSGAFSRLLEIDSIQAPSNNVDSWLQRFIDLTIHSKNT
jgi:hypothetical protein